MEGVARPFSMEELRAAEAVEVQGTVFLGGRLVVYTWGSKN